MKAWITSILAVCLIVLSGCGPGEGGTGGFSASVGRVDGFGSTFVEGERLEDRDARIAVDVDPRAPTPAPLTAIGLGAQVTAQTRDGSLLSGTSSAELLGQITTDFDDTTSAFVLMGQRVITRGHPLVSPVVEGGAGFDFLAGTVVEVHGMRLSNGDIVATRIAHRAPDTRTVRLAGPISALDRAAGTFRIGTMQVQFGAASVLPSTAALADGRRVVVFSVRDQVSAARVVAQAVRVEETNVAEGDVLRIAGFATQVSGSSFRLRGVTVDAANARISGATSVRDDQLLRVRGTYERGALKASDIVVLGPNDSWLLVQGPISDFSGADNAFRLRGATVRIDSSTRWMAGSAENLSNGVPLAVRGRIIEGEVRAAELSLVPDAPVVAGAVSSLDTAARSFRLTPDARLVRYPSDLVLRNGSLADLANGRRVRVLGSVSANELLARELVFLDSVATPLTVILTGVLSDPRPLGIFVGDTLVSVNAQTLVTGGRTGTQADLDGGLFAVVRAVRQGTTLSARSIEIKPDLDATSVVLGYISEYTSPQALRVAGQRVDASAAQLVNPGVQRFGDGTFALVEGAMRDGVLRATRVELLPN
jgi:hypothetical protein